MQIVTNRTLLLCFVLSLCTLSDAIGRAERSDSTPAKAPSTSFSGISSNLRAPTREDDSQNQNQLERNLRVRGSNLNFRGISAATSILAGTVDLEWFPALRDNGDVAADKDLSYDVFCAVGYYDFPTLNGVATQGDVDMADLINEFQDEANSSLMYHNTRDNKYTLEGLEKGVVHTFLVTPNIQDYSPSVGDTAEVKVSSVNPELYDGAVLVDTFSSVFSLDLVELDEIKSQLTYQGRIDTAVSKQMMPGNFVSGITTSGKSFLVKIIGIIQFEATRVKLTVSNANLSDVYKNLEFDGVYNTDRVPDEETVYKNGAQKDFSCSSRNPVGIFFGKPARLECLGSLPLVDFNESFSVFNDLLTIDAKAKVPLTVKASITVRSVLNLVQASVEATLNYDFALSLLFETELSISGNSTFSTNTTNSTQGNTTTTGNNTISTNATNSSLWANYEGPVASRAFAFGIPVIGIPIVITPTLTAGTAYEITGSFKVGVNITVKGLARGGVTYDRDSGFSPIKQLNTPNPMIDPILPEGSLSFDGNAFLEFTVDVNIVNLLEAAVNAKADVTLETELALTNPFLLSRFPVSLTEFKSDLILTLGGSGKALGQGFDEQFFKETFGLVELPSVTFQANECSCEGNDAFIRISSMKTPANRTLFLDNDLNLKDWLFDGTNDWEFDMESANEAFLRKQDGCGDFGPNGDFYFLGVPQIPPVLFKVFSDSLNQTAEQCIVRATSAPSSSPPIGPTPGTPAPTQSPSFSATPTVAPLPVPQRWEPRTQFRQPPLSEVSRFATDSGLDQPGVVFLWNALIAHAEEDVQIGDVAGSCVRRRVASVKKPGVGSCIFTYSDLFGNTVTAGGNVVDGMKNYLDITAGTNDYRGARGKVLLTPVYDVNEVGNQTDFFTNASLYDGVLDIKVRGGKGGKKGSKASKTGKKTSGKSGKKSTKIHERALL